MAETNGTTNGNVAGASSPAEEVSAYIQARFPLLYLVSPEEARVERALMSAAKSNKMNIMFWSTTKGFENAIGQTESNSLPDPREALAFLLDAKRSRAKSTMYVLRDFHRYMTEAVAVRAFRDLAREIRLEQTTVCTIVILAPILALPLELQNDVIVLRWPLPKRQDIARIVDECVAVQKQMENLDVLAGTTRDAIIGAALGLTADGVGDALSRSIVLKRRLDPRIINVQKKQVVAASGVAEWVDLDNVPAIGGMARAVEVIDRFGAGLSEAARLYGLDPPKGMLITGWTGTGKSLAIKHLALRLGVPLLRIDVGMLMSKWQGEQSEKTRRLFELLKALAPVVGWLDEVEKMWAGVGKDAETSGGTKTQMFGDFLTFLAERKIDDPPIIMGATANEVDALPAETFRQGRFDVVLAVLEPTLSERRAILQIHLERRKRKAGNFDIDRVARATKGFTGAELEGGVVVSGMYRAFQDNQREVATDDLLWAAANTRPMSMTRKTKLESLKKWVADTGAILASDPDPEEESDLNEMVDQRSRFAKIG